MAERAWVVAPFMWLLLMVMVPPVVINFWLRIGPPRLTLAEHQAIAASYQEHGETVDVFLPSCGEPLAVLNNTFRYVSEMDWPGLKTVYVLDDSARGHGTGPGGPVRLPVRRAARSRSYEEGG